MEKRRGGDRKRQKQEADTLSEAWQEGSSKFELHVSKSLQRTTCLIVPFAQKCDLQENTGEKPVRAW